MSNDLMNETIQCLSKTFTVADKNERQAAEARLKELEGDLLTHFKVLLETIKNESYLKKELKVSVILYLKKIIKSRIEDKSLNKDDAISIIKYFIDTILTSNLSEVCLQNLSHSLQDLLNFKLISENKSICGELVDLLMNYLQSNVGSNVNYYRSIIVILETIILSSSVGHSNAVDILKKMLMCAEFMLGNLTAAFVANQGDQGNKQSSDFIAVYLGYTEVSRHLFNFLHSSVLKMRSRLNILSKVAHLYSETLMEGACNIVLMQVPIVETGVTSTQYIAFQKNSEFDNSVNQMKAKALQFINAVVNNYNSKLSENQSQNRLITAYSSLIRVIIDTLDETVTNVDRFSYLQEMSKDSTTFPDYNYSNVFYHMILFIARIIVKSPFMENFTDYSKSFAKSIIIPLLIGSKVEIAQMKENGEDYCNYLTDVIDDHKTKTIKSVTAFLLQNMSEKFDGFGAYVATYCLQLVDFVIRGGDVNALLNDTSSSQQYKLLSPEDRIFKLPMCDSQTQIETSFLIFSILTSYILRHSNLKATLKSLTETHFQTLLNVNSDLIRNRLCLFLGIYVDSLFEPDDLHFAFCVEYLFINLFYYKENKGVAHQAADSLNDLLGVTKFALALKELIGKYLPTLIENIKDIKIGLFFDVLLEIVMNIDIESYIVQLTSELAKRVLAEIAPYTRIKFRVTKEDGTVSSSRREKNTQYNITVNKCFNIIRTIADRESYVVNHILDFENILDPIFDHMKNPSKIDFDEDIVLIITSFIKHLKTIPTSALKVLPHLPKYMKKSNGLLLDLYELINQYVVYGKGIIDVTEEYNKVIMKIFRASFDQNADSEKGPFLGASLMQVWVQNSNTIPTNMVKEIMLISIDRIKGVVNKYKNLEDFEESSDVYNFIALTVLIYSGFINYPYPTFEAIINNNDVVAFMKWSEQLLSLQFHSTYLSKSLIIGICAFLRNEGLLKQIPEYINKFLHFLLILLNKQKHEESRSLKQVLKKEIHCNFIDSDEEDEDSDESENEEINSQIMNINKMLSKDMEKIYNKFNIDEYSGYTNEREIVDICERTINPVKSLDEYEFFKNSIEFINNIDSSFWNNWINTLSDKERIDLDNLIHTRRISINHNKISANVPRKVVRIVKRGGQGVGDMGVDTSLNIEK